MKRATLLLALLGFCAIVGAPGCGSSDQVAGPGPEPGPSPARRRWVLEKEFRQQPGLRASPRQVVILDIAHDTGPVLHQIPYRFDEAAKYEVCVSEDEEHITEIILYDDASSELAHLGPEVPCDEFEVAPGEYRMEIIHDGTTVPAQSKPGFVFLAMDPAAAPAPRGGNQRVHGARAQAATSAASSYVPNPGRVLVARAANGMYIDLINEGTSGWPYCISSSIVPDFNQFCVFTSLYGGACERGERVFQPPGVEVHPLSATNTHAWEQNCNFLLDESGNVRNCQLLAVNIDPYSHYSHYVPWDSPYPFTLLWNEENWNEYSINPAMLLAESGMAYNPPCFPQLPLSPVFALNANGNASFTLYSRALGSLSMGDDGSLQMTPTGSPEYLEIAAMVDFDSCNLLPGEFALTGSSGGAGSGCLIFKGSQPDLTDFLGDNGLSGLSKILLGPDTGIILYAGQNYTGTSTSITHETTLDNPLDANASAEVMTSYQMLVTTKTCSYCDLTGVDLSSMNLSGFDIDHADLTGANFDCANLDGTDLSYATLDDASLDYSAQGCQVSAVQGINLSDASLKGATIKNVSFENGTDGTPTNLSNVPLSKAILTQVTFSGADLSNTSFDESAVLTNVTFTNADLSNASIASATLDTVTFQGADLNLAHVDFTSPSSLDGVRFNGNIACASFDGMNLPTEETGGKLAFTDACIFGTSYDCRTGLGSATVDMTLFTTCASPSGGATPSVVECLGQLRYMNLDSATLRNVDVLTSSNNAPLDLTGAIFSNLDLSGLTLDYADLGCDGSTCTDLSGTNLSNTSLSHVNLQGANLRNADLDNAYLSHANLNSASLGETGTQYYSASFTGAYMKNVNLSQVNASGVNFDNVNFYSGTQGPCSSADWPGGNCASAVGATLNNSSFSGAYLNGVDFSDATLLGASFYRASMFATIFSGTQLGPTTGTGQSADFDSALLGGANFSNVGSLNGASFRDAHGTVEVTGGLTVCELIAGANTQFEHFGEEGFPGYCAAGASSCTQRPQGHTDCVSYSYTQATVWPSGTNASNKCFDGSEGPCDGKWNTDQPGLQNSGLPEECSPSPPGKSCVQECGFFGQCTDETYPDLNW